MIEKLTMINRDKKKLAVILNIPNEKTDKIIILSASFRGHMTYQPIMTDLALAAEKEGYAVLRYDYFGSGASEGTFEQATVTSETNDLKDIINYVKEKGYKKICLAGLSIGSSNSISAYDDSITCLLLLSPPFNHDILYERYKEKIMKQGFAEKKFPDGSTIRLGKKMWEEFGKIDLTPKLKEIKCPVLGVFGTEDILIKKERVEKFMKLINSEKRLKIISGADHDFYNKQAEEKAIKVSIAWLKEHLK